MRPVIFMITLLSLVNGCQVADRAPLENIKWIHGSPSCSQNTDPPIQVVAFDEFTWILRQNKCVHPEAPFMFLFIGNEKALLVDTGATEDETAFPLYKTVTDLLSDQPLELVVVHTHNHSDHYAADSQFVGKPKTTVVGLQPGDVASFFQVKDWPNEIVAFELGGRKIDIIPIPGHEASSIALYDAASKLLLTGDTFYPGRLYVRDWSAFRQSIQRLVDFASTKEIDYVLGNHIEMSTRPGEDYPVDATYQPKEHPLPLYMEDLKFLHGDLRLLGDSPVRKVYDHFIVYPLD